MYIKVLKTTNIVMGLSKSVFALDSQWKDRGKKLISSSPRRAATRACGAAKPRASSWLVGLASRKTKCSSTKNLPSVEQAKTWRVML